ncbi:MAG TPA: two-component regulator propeller domain-containing protein [Blastocatellia bacterium]|nr:two-component regulator propeller domain-containing protein [Blastocatellia bacterium]
MSPESEPVLGQDSLRLTAHWVGVFSSLFLYLIASSAAHGQYRFDSWTTDNGLPQNSVRAIIQTRDGYLWLATSDGLVRFDGVRFTIFNKGNTQGIMSNRFSCLVEDNSGVLWAGTEDGGLSRYQNGKFRSYTTADGLLYNRVEGVRAERDGGLTIATMRGLCRLANGEFTPYAPKPNEPDSFGYRDSSGALWYLDDEGLHSVINSTRTSYKAPNRLSAPDVRGVYPGLYKGILEDREHSVWVATIAKGLYRFNGGAVTVYTGRDGVPDSLGAMCQDQKGNLWIGTGNGTLVRFKDGEFTSYGPGQGFLADQVNSIYQDREGTLWVGTGNRGLYRVTEKTIACYTKENGLCSDIVYSIYQDRADRIWIGTWGGGLVRYSDGSFTCYTRKDGLPDPSVTALFEDERYLWIGTLGGIAFMDGGRIVDFSDKLPPQLRGTNVRAIYRDHSGALWLGTESRGLARYVGSDVTVFTTKDGLAGDAVKAIMEDREGRLWIATFGGLSRFANGRFQSWTEQDGLASDRVRALYEDADGVLWIGTYDGGLCRFESGKFSTFTTRDGLFNNGVFQILEDDRGNLWMSSNLGIYSVSRASLNDFARGRIHRITCVPYRKSDGLLTVECNGGSQPAGVKSRDGKLWFPTQSGVAVIDPRNIPFNPNPPPVVIEGCSVDGRAVDNLGNIEIGPGRRDLEINYTALSFVKSDHITFRYRLDGLDRDWVDIGTRRTAYYSYLPPGSYRFRVIAANTDGVWNLTGAGIGVRVIPPFYRTWWFLILAAFSVIGMGVVVYERRLRQLRRAKSAQEDFSRRLIDLQERERKRIAAELHDSLGQSLAIIKNRALLGLNSPEDENVLMDQFHRITEHADHAIKEVKDISYDLRPYLLDRLGLTRAVQSMLNKVADSSGIRFDTDIDQLDKIFSKEEEIGLYRIVQESVNNIIKHSGATEAMVVIKNEDGEVAVTIQDNGKGFTPELLDGSTSRRGFGLFGMAERARILGSKPDIHSSPGRGTTITLKLKARSPGLRR